MELKIFDNRRNIRIFLAIFFVSLAILLFVDFFIKKHASFGWSQYPDFYAAYGFISCVVLIYLSKLLRRLVQRDENYYAGKDENHGQH